MRWKYLSAAPQLASALLFSFLLSACLTSPDPEASYPLAAQDDKPYFAAYQQVSKRVDVINNFETKFTVDASHLTTAFRQAMATRYEHIFKDKEPALAEAASKTGIFVSVYTSNRELSELSRRDLWTIFLEGNGQKIAPTTIQRLSPKERWAPFFPAISPWSQDYLLLFDVPPAAGDAPSSLVLSMASPDGSVRIEF